MARKVPLPIWAYIGTGAGAGYGPSQAKCDPTDNDTLIHGLGYNNELLRHQSFGREDA